MLPADQYDMEKTQAPRDRDAEIREKLLAERMMQAQVGVPVGYERDVLDDLFRYHPPGPEDLPKYAAINQAAKNFAEVLRANCPMLSQDYRDAIRFIRMARMIANASVALKGRGL